MGLSRGRILVRRRRREETRWLEECGFLSMTLAAGQLFRST
jgi:hypothetical protein